MSDCIATSISRDNSTHIMHLVGWQGTGHDTLYPSLDRLNPNVGTKTDLERLAIEARKYNTLISYHINTDEAYKNLTAAKGCDLSVHPVPGTDDGKHNPDFQDRIMAHQPDGSDFVWFGAAEHTDPLQGPSYHLSKTKDVASGQRWKRVQAFLGEAAGGTLSLDATTRLFDAAGSTAPTTI